MGDISCFIVVVDGSKTKSERDRLRQSFLYLFLFSSNTPLILPGTT